MTDTERLVRIIRVDFDRGDGPSSAWQVVHEDGEPVGLGLFRTRDIAREAANKRGLTILIEEE